MKERYVRNMNMFTEEECERLQGFSVCVIGAGGLGGYVVEMLARIGIGNLTVVDGDVFNESNLNRQLLCLEDNIGESKVEHAGIRVARIDSSVEARCIGKMIDYENCSETIRGHDVVVDALDNIGVRKILQDICEKERIPLIHGAIAGWYGQITTILPGDRTLDKLYRVSENGVEKSLGNPSFTPAVVAGIQVSETIKLLLEKGELLRHKVLFIDTLVNDMDVVEFTN